MLSFSNKEEEEAYLTQKQDGMLASGRKHRPRLSHHSSLDVRKDIVTRDIQAPYSKQRVFSCLWAH